MSLFYNLQKCLGVAGLSADVERKRIRRYLVLSSSCIENVDTGVGAR